jgi:hypothetical protein
MVSRSLVKRGPLVDNGDESLTWRVFDRTQSTDNTNDTTVRNVRVCAAIVGIVEYPGGQNQKRKN